MLTDKKRRVLLAVTFVLLVFVLAGLLIYNGRQTKQHSRVSFAMDTVVTQYAYGVNANDALYEVSKALVEEDARLSLFKENSEVARINAAAGKGGAEVSAETAALLEKALALSAQSEGAFAITIAPLTLAWGVTTDNPHLVPNAQLAQLLPLVGDEMVRIEGTRVLLPKEGMGIDLGGIAKGAACQTAMDIYEKHGVRNALLSIGGNVYARGTKPGGEKWTVGFRDPTKGREAYVASFSMQDKVIAVSGGYERFFELDGKQYIHILDPRTGKPAQSDILSVGVIHPDGAVADFYSTTLFVQGLNSALAYMQSGGEAIVIDSDYNLYLSAGLEEDFELYEEVVDIYTLNLVEADAP